MRGLILGLLLGASLVAQTEPPDGRTTPPGGQSGKTEATPPAAGEKKADAPRLPRFFVYPPRLDPRQPGTPQSGKTVLKPNQPCAIPLINALKPVPKPDRMIIPVPPAPRFSMREAPLPAPSCDDVKK